MELFSIRIQRTFQLVSTKITNGCFLIKVFKVPEYTNSGYFGTKKHTDQSDYLFKIIV